jgi:hypothetical protein
MTLGSVQTDIRQLELRKTRRLVSSPVLPASPGAWPSSLTITKWHLPLKNLRRRAGFEAGRDDEVAHRGWSDGVLNCRRDPAPSVPYGHALHAR